MLILPFLRRYPGAPGSSWVPRGARGSSGIPGIPLPQPQPQSQIFAAAATSVGDERHHRGQDFALDTKTTRVEEGKVTDLERAPEHAATCQKAPFTSGRIDGRRLNDNAACSHHKRRRFQQQQQHRPCEQHRPRRLGEHQYRRGRRRGRRDGDWPMIELTPCIFFVRGSEPRMRLGIYHTKHHDEVRKPGCLPAVPMPAYMCPRDCSPPESRGA